MFVSLTCMRCIDAKNAKDHGCITVQNAGGHRLVVAHKHDEC